MMIPSLVVKVVFNFMPYLHIMTDIISDKGISRRIQLLIKIYSISVGGNVSVRFNLNLLGE